jgi:threonine/homoserine/homoserine lactone efflux protein
VTGVGVRPSGSPLLQGMISELLNPKTALFFLAFVTMIGLGGALALAERG